MMDRYENYKDLAIVLFAGKSMQPLFIDGDQLLVYFFKSKEESEALEVGDIVLFKTLEAWTAHRIVSENKTKGDRSLFPDIDQGHLWGRIDGMKSKKNIYFWGSRGMIFKKRVARVSIISATFLKWKRWPALILLWGIIKIGLALHQIKESEAPQKTV